MQRFGLPGGDLEYAIMSKLWDLGSASVRKIHEQIGEPAGLVYTTTAKVLDRLYAKRLVSRKRSGIAFIYRPRVAREVVEKSRARTILARLLGPAPRTAVATLVDAVETLDPKLLDDLADAVAARRRHNNGT